ncbi:glycosyl hydrolase family 5 [Solitalea longa]|uniref:Glycosyl hydrolase family 5 n=1 Tax=Solitalea longa TaxID=2079460 RepID=A0A2S5A2A1_9SPHI|nr:glycoside hydrolase family 5 protein [Solitalea longa]POY36654.1 glycosyl hydrolase family 5 [Solitalea longa]
MRKKIFLFVFVNAVCGLITAAFAQTAPRAIDQHGALSVQHNIIVDKNGVPPQLRGISMSWSIWAGKKYYNNNVVDWLVDDFKISVLRASMAVQPDGGYLQQPEEQLQLITQTIDKAVERGIYVLIDWHDHNAEKHLSESKAFFAQMAKRYAGKPNVIYEIWNEPEHQSWPVIKQYAIEVINEIRKYDADNLIIVGSTKWDQEVDVTAKDPITGYKNIAYSFHFYASDPNHQDRLRSKAEKAMKKGLPLFVTEWGVGESNGDGVFDLKKTETWFNWMETHKLSWANWNITDKKETTALLQPGASVNANWTKEELTPAGIYIREQLRKFNNPQKSSETQSNN